MVAVMLVLLACSDDPTGNQLRASEACTQFAEHACAKANSCGFLNGHPIAECESDMVWACCAEDGTCDELTGITQGELNTCVEDLEAFTCEEAANAWPTSCLTI